MRALVTGGTGFIGSAVARTLVSAGHCVRALVRPGSNRQNLEGIPIEVVLGDLLDEVSLSSAVKGCDAVFHVAADYRLWVPDPDRLSRINVAGTIALFRAASAAGVPRMVYTSSVATIGNREDSAPADESTPSSFDAMIGEYKRSKFRAERAVCALVVEQEFPIVIVNPSTPVGPRDIKPTPTGRMIVDAANRRIPAYVDTGLNVVHVDDVARGHLLAFEHGRIGERYILGGENMSLRDILATVASAAGHRPPHIRLPHAVVAQLAYTAEAIARVTGGAPRVTVDEASMSRKPMYFSSAKAERDLGYKAGAAESAITDAVAWFRDHGYLKERGRR